MAGKLTEVARLSAVLQRGGYRRVVLVFDDRDDPPWTAELVVENRVLAVRFGATLQEAVTLIGLADTQSAAERARLVERPNYRATRRTDASAP